MLQNQLNKSEYGSNGNISGVLNSPNNSKNIIPNNLVQNKPPVPPIIPKEKKEPATTLTSTSAVVN
jgi:hypothetical protein